MAADYSKDKMMHGAKPYNKNLYQQLLGALMQLIDTRPDISFALSKCAQRTNECTENDAKALMRIVLYLQGTRYLGLRITRANRHQQQSMVRLRAYTDAAYANMNDAKSQYSFGFDLIPYRSDDTMIDPQSRADNTGMFYSKSSTCTGTSLSSTDSELTGMVECAKTILFLREILNELHQPQVQATTLYNDNKSSITLATAYSGNHKRIRYMLPKVTWMMEQVRGQAIRLQYLATGILPQDIGTKALPGPEFMKKRSLLMGHKDEDNKAA
jgi:hypothetical protein